MQIAPTTITHPLDYVVITYRYGSRKVEHFGNVEFARLHAIRNSPGYVFRADQVSDPDRGYLCRTDKLPLFYSNR